MARKIMIQGTMSSAGKSLIAAGLCRIFHQDGYRVAPFKSQNMALNSFVTEEGLEMGRAQVMQAEAAGTVPTVDMNPILLKPTSDRGSQIIVRGEVLSDMDARAYFQYKTELIPVIKESFARLEDDYDIIVIEGAGSPAEINLKENDIVNMGIAKMFDANVLLVGDIDRGGVFAQLVGTIELLPEDERKLIKGLVINKFRGDKSLLDPGIDMLYEKCRIPVCGTVPYIKDLKVDDEDSLAERLYYKNVKDKVDIAVIRLPHISNFTDFDVFDSIPGCGVRFVDEKDMLSGADIVILPGSKNTIYDMQWLKDRGLDSDIKKAAERIPVFGICGGFQMLGLTINDEYGVDNGLRSSNDSSGNTLMNERTADSGISGNNCMTSGLGLLPVHTSMKKDKTRRQVSGNLPEMAGILSPLSGKRYSGYEIHMGETLYENMSGEMKQPDGMRTDRADNTDNGAIQNDEVIISSGNVYGSYVHGIFDDSDIAWTLVRTLAERKGLELDETNGGAVSYKDFKEQQYDALADVLRENLDMEYIYSVM
ncbi:MAG: cobyric acid synthase [Eubacterium sp.]|nr:cobyric acid synthase [Eubacterium sp.]